MNLTKEQRFEAEDIRYRIRIHNTRSQQEQLEIARRANELKYDQEKFEESLFKQTSGYQFNWDKLEIESKNG